MDENWHDKESRGDLSKRAAQSKMYLETFLSELVDYLLAHQNHLNGAQKQEELALCLCFRLTQKGACVGLVSRCGVLFFSGNLLHVHLKGGGDVGGVGQVPAAVEALGVGVGAAGDGRLSWWSCNHKENNRKVWML